MTADDDRGALYCISPVCDDDKSMDRAKCRRCRALASRSRSTSAAAAAAEADDAMSGSE